MKNEFEWIRSIAPSKHRRASVIKGIGDDAAVIRPKVGYDIVLAVDTLVEGVHFTKNTMPLKAIGYKALAVNVSDLAAMGAEPLYYMVSIAVPKENWEQEEINEIYEGMGEAGEEYDMDLIGGDTISTSRDLVITVQVTGRVEEYRQLLRSDAETNDIVFLTGPVGMSAAGLDELLEKGKDAWGDDPFIQAHQWPIAHVEHGRFFAESGERIALNDVSDGVAHEAKEIAESSGVDLHLDWEKMPRLDLFQHVPLTKQRKWLLHGGEDFSLLGTMRASLFQQMKKQLQKKGLSLYQIGEVRPGRGNVWLKHEGTEKLLYDGGYTHF
ncbi:thiamine-phosphate kinase [Alkalicoccus daliensis]|uniref:Thiamine-monophosphate kinase n=1 Tax=Alkalicoccus daliensis TaxID=745820 RepID=A0A1H0H978_9BACI|nr:thiamine-phosphate kinase [Alkalicoccus daliensis]SDO15604.1 thiamine-monophosphate kinase [Alkalicoccus daliensis]